MKIGDDKYVKYMGHFEKEYAYYFLDRYPIGFFDVFVDIGACLGYVSRRIAEENSRTRVFSFEPSSEEYDVLAKMAEGFPNIETFKCALGDGCDGTIHREEGFIGRNTFVQGDGGDRVPSLTLGDMFKNNCISTDGAYALKIDCEGGERFLIGDKEAAAILKNAVHVAMEIHFKPVSRRGKPSPYPQFDSYPEYIEFYNWIHSVFDKTHNIKYHNSNKHSGLGTFVMAKHEYMDRNWNFKKAIKFSSYDDYLKLQTSKAINMSMSSEEGRQWEIKIYKKFKMKMVSILKQFLSPDKVGHILVLGARWGSDVLFLREGGYDCKITAIDLYNPPLSKDVLFGDAHNLSFLKDKIDLVWAYNVFEHLLDPSKVVDEICKYSENCHLAITVPDFETATDPYDANDRFKNAEDFRNIFVSKGFNEIFYEKYFIKSKSNPPDHRFIFRK